MTKTTAARRLAHGWRYLPAASAPIGGGLIKIGRASTWAAVSVGLAPYAIWAALCAVFLIGYLAALIRYICSGQEGQDAMACLITTSVNAIVSILTLTPPTPMPAKCCRQADPQLYSAYSNRAAPDRRALRDGEISPSRLAERCDGAVGFSQGPDHDSKRRLHRAGRHPLDSLPGTRRQHCVVERLVVAARPEAPALPGRIPDEQGHRNRLSVGAWRDRLVPGLGGLAFPDLNAGRHQRRRPVGEGV